MTCRAVSTSLMSTLLLFFSLTSMGHAQAAGAEDQVAKLTHILGSAQLFTQPSKKPHSEKGSAEGSTALYEGEYFRVREAKVGDVIEQGNIIRTHPTARARVIYTNGDQIVIGPGSAYRVHWDAKTGANPKVDIIYGKVRGVVSKEGPRSKFTLRTKTATMGVRGTDFFIVEGKDGETEVSVVRGVVEVRPTAEGAEPIVVKTGYTATVAVVEEKTARSAQPEGPPPGAQPESSTVLRVSPKVELRQTTQQDFSGMQKSSDVVRPASEQQKLPPQVAKEVAQLEKKAIEVTLKDIQTHQPELHAKLSPGVKSIRNAEELNARAVEELSRAAPPAPAKRKKPSATEMEQVEEEDAYRKYFKLQK